MYKIQPGFCRGVPSLGEEGVSWLCGTNQNLYNSPFWRVVNDGQRNLSACEQDRFILTELC